MRPNFTQKHLEVLGYRIGDRPTPRELKDRWKDLCRKYHPDTGGDVELFRKVTHAYKMLSDPAYRNRSEVDNIRNKSPNARGDLNIRITRTITFDEGFFGCEKVLSFNIRTLGEDFSVQEVDKEEVVAFPVVVPEGSCTGYDHVEEGSGNKRGDHQGNVLVSFMVQPHPKFRIVGMNVVSQENVPLSVMLKGGDITVPTMYGIKTVRVPPGTSPGAELKVKGCGIGDSFYHLVIVQPVFPDKEELKKEVWSSLDIDWESDEAADEGEKELMDIFKKISSTGTIGVF